MNISKIVPPYQRKNSTCNVEILLGHCTSRKVFSDKQMSQMDMRKWSFLDPLKQWESDYTPSNRLRNSNTHGLPNVQAFDQWRKAKNALYELLHLASSSRCKLESSWEVEFGPTLSSRFPPRWNQISSELHRQDWPIGYQKWDILSHCLRVSRFQHEQPLVI